MKPLPRPVRTLDDMRRYAEAASARRVGADPNLDVVQLGEYEFHASGAGQPSHNSGEDLQVFLAPFQVERPMSVRRLSAWFSSTVSNTVQACLALYQNRSLRTINPQSLFEPRQEFRLLARARVQTVSDTDPVLYSQDLEHEVRLLPGAYAVGYQFDNDTGRWFYNRSAGAGFMGYSTIHEAVERAGEFPIDIIATLPQRTSPFLFVRSREGVRIRPLQGET